MTKMFLSFLEISIPISFIIAVLLLLAPFLNKRYAAKWKYWIWIVLALRLMIPLGGDGGQPAADLQPQGETLTSLESEKTPPVAPADGTVRGRVIVEIPAQMTNPIVMQHEKAGSNLSVLDIIALVWMLGSLLFISVNMVSYFLYKHEILKKGKAVKDNEVLHLLRKLKQELHINCTVSVIEYPVAASPLLIGFLHPILVLPKTQYKIEELFFILKHELIHLKRGDIYFKLLFVAANAVHWFNPLIRIMQKEAAVDMELSCDERVTQGADYAARKAYTETLLSALHKQSAKNTVLSTGFYGGKQIMKKRFQNILAKTGKKNGAVVLICAFLLAVSLGTLVGCSIMKENAETAPGRLGTEDPETKDIQAENSQNDETLSESTAAPTASPMPEPTPKPLIYTMDGEEYEVVCNQTDFMVYSDFKELEENSELIVIGHFVEDAVENGNAYTNAFEITQVLKGFTEDDVIRIYQRYTVSKSSKRIVAYSHLTPMEKGSEWICFLKCSNPEDVLYYHAGDTMGRYPFREIDQSKWMNGEYSSKEIGVYQAEDFRYDIYKDLLEEYGIQFE